MVCMKSPVPDTEPQRDCALCPRLAGHREQCRAAHPDYWNAPVAAFGDANARLAIVGLAPGLHGANRTGLPFQGDASGDLLWTALAQHGFAKDAPKGFVILNAVKCLPPGNRPTPEEVRTCRPFLERTLAALPKLRTIIALGSVAHQSCVKACGGKLPKHRFAHGAVHRMINGKTLIDSYHPSRLNQNTGRVTVEMVAGVIEAAAKIAMTTA